MILDSNVRYCGCNDSLVGHTPREAAGAAAAAIVVVAAKQRLVQRVDAVDFSVEVRLERVEPLGNRKALCACACVCVWVRKNKCIVMGWCKTLCERQSCVRETKIKRIVMGWCKILCERQACEMSQ